MSSQRKAANSKMESVMAILFLLHHANGRNRLFVPYPCLPCEPERDGITFLFRQGSGALAFVQNFCHKANSKSAIKKLNIVLNLIVVKFYWIGEFSKNSNMFITDTNVLHYKRVNFMITFIKNNTMSIVMDYILSPEMMYIGMMIG